MRTTSLAAKFLGLLIAALAILSGRAAVAADPWVVYEGQAGPGQGKHIVLVSGDEEYRSEEMLPALGKILAKHHGCKCTVLFAINPLDGTIDPNNQQNIPGLEALDHADMMVLFLRFRELPDEQMKHIVDFVNSGKPVLGIRTATHAFSYSRSKTSPYAKWSFNSQQWPGGFGQQVLGETWVNHHGHHGVESSRGIVNPAFKDSPVLRGVEDIWGPTDVYTVTHLIPEAQVLVHGQVLEGMQPTDKPVVGKKNEPMLPLAWLKSYTGSEGKTSRIFCTTMGCSVDFESAGFRRLLVNGCYWGLGLESQIPAQNNVDLVGPYKPTPMGGSKYTKGVKPVDLKL